MVNPTLQTQPGIQFEQLEKLLDNSSREYQRSLENKADQHHFTAQNALNNQIKELKTQNKNSFRAALFGFFMRMAAMAANFIPQAGPFVSKLFDSLGQTLNPFQLAAEKAGIKAQEEGLEGEEENQRSQKLIRQADESEKNRDLERQRMEKAMASLESSQEAVLRI